MGRRVSVYHLDPIFYFLLPSRQTVQNGGDGDSSSDNEGNDMKNGDGDDSDGKNDGHKSDSSLEIIQSWKTRSRTTDPENGE